MRKKKREGEVGYGHRGSDESKTRLNNCWVKSLNIQTNIRSQSRNELGNKTVSPNSVFIHMLVSQHILENQNFLHLGKIILAVPNAAVPFC